MAPPHERTLGAGLGFVWNKTRVLGILGLAAVLQMKDLNKSCYFFPAIKKRAFLKGIMLARREGFALVRTAARLAAVF